MTALVVPTSWSLAWAWVHGEIWDVDLVNASDLDKPTGEALWICSWYGPGAGRSLVAQLLAWRGSARVIVLRTRSAQVDRICRRWRMTAVWTELATGETRWWLQETGVSRVLAFLAGERSVKRHQMPQEAF